MYYIRAIVCSLVFFSCFQTVDAGPFGFFNFRGRNGGGDGNVVQDAPAAPEGLDDYGMPSINSSVNMRCDSGGCELSDVTQLQPIAQSVPMAPMPVAQLAPTVVTRRVIMAPMPQAVSVGPAVVVANSPPVVTGRLSPEDRIDRLVTALEEKLGIKMAPEPAMSGNPAILFNSLPVIEIIKRKQDGTIDAKVELNTMLWVKRQLELKE